MIIPLYLGLFLNGALGTCANMKYGRTTKNRSDYLVYVIITGIIAIGVFCILSGFSFAFNRRTVIYSVIFAATIVVMHILTLLRLRLMEIMQITLISSPLSLIMTLAAGYFFFSEEISWITVLRVILSIAAAWLSVPVKTSSTQTQHLRYDFLLGLILCVVLAILGVFSNILQKAFAIDPSVTDTNSMFFLTNVWMVLICVIGIFLLDKGHIFQVLRDFKDLSLLQYGAVILNTVSNNIGTVLNLELLAIVPMSIHVPVSDALGKLSTAAVATFVAKEKVPLIPIILAVISALLTFFEL